MAKNIDELIAKDDEMKLLLAWAEKNIYEYRKFTDLKVQLEKNIEKYEDYIAKTQSDSQKEKEICEQMMEELKQKESEFKTLQEVSKKQNEYDAQGFDGKEHLSYLENQSEELGDKLDIKRIIVELKHKCWEVEAEYLKRCTKVIDDAKSFRRSYNDVINALNDVLDSLLSMTNLEVQNSCRSFHLEFPVWEIDSNQNLESIKDLRDTLEDIVNEIKSRGESLKSIYATMDEALTKMEMIKSEVSMTLKLFIQESEQELTSKRKIADEISSLKVRCEKIDKSPKSLQDEKSELEKILRKKIEEKNALHELLERKKKELKEWLIQKK